MSPGNRARHRPRSILTALVLLALGVSCLWLAETATARVEALTDDAPLPIAVSRDASR
jgi:hypothetical protein